MVTHDAADVPANGRVLLLKDGEVTACLTASP